MKTLIDILEEQLKGKRIRTRYYPTTPLYDRYQRDEVDNIIGWNEYEKSFESEGIVDYILPIDRDACVHVFFTNNDWASIDLNEHFEILEN